MDASTKTGLKLVVDAAGDRAIVMIRAVAVPRALVFEAFTKPELLARWVGHRDWTMPICEVDLRVGGKWRYVLRGPDGASLGLKGVYQELLPPERLVTTERFDEWRIGVETVNTLTLAERYGVTTINWHVLYPTREVRDSVLEVNSEGDPDESFDRLEELLATMDR
jgi:uncharacterized protein YndB with AHSA1/START domain